MDRSSYSGVKSCRSFQPICPVCKGIGDLKNPRGVLVKLPDNHHSHKRYAYVYMHHPNLRVLCYYAEACKMCQLLRRQLRIHIPRDLDKTATAGSPAPGCMGTHSTWAKHAAESDDNDPIDTDLAELTKPENLRIRLDFEAFSSRRIVLRHFSDENNGPRGCIDHFDIEVIALGHHLSGSLPGFKHPCGSMLHNGIMTLLGDADAG